MTPSAIRCLLVLLLTLLTMTSASADEFVPAGDCPSPQTLKKCGELGENYYQRGQYALAIHAFRQAYALKPLTVFLYNMAQAHRLAGQSDEAIQLYQRYLIEEPQTPLKAEIEGHLSVLRQTQEAERQATALRAQAAERASHLRPDLVAQPALPPRPLYKKWWFWTTMGVVAAGAVVIGAVLSNRSGEPTLSPLDAR